MASPEHIGSWAGTIADVVTVTIEVGGTPGQYTAQYHAQAIGFGDEGDMSLTFSGGKADATGNLTFDKNQSSELTLGPVSAGQMRAELTTKLSAEIAEQAGQETVTQACDVSRLLSGSEPRDRQHLPGRVPPRFLQISQLFRNSGILVRLSQRTNPCKSAQCPRSSVDRAQVS